MIKNHKQTNPNYKSKSHIQAHRKVSPQELHARLVSKLFVGYF